jgi:hypothetical protein
VDRGTVKVNVVPAKCPSFFRADASHNREDQVGADDQVGFGCLDEPDRHVASPGLRRASCRLALGALGQGCQVPTACLAYSQLDRGGAKGTRTPDPLLAKQVLFQLSYSPELRRSKGTWAGTLMLAGFS